jgi:3-isopropylmalate/(R)-2-methylmalate dehydratase small subunit
MALEKDAKGAVDIQVQLQEQKVVAKGNGQEKSFAFEISLFDKALVEAGGWVEYADARY